MTVSNKKKPCSLLTQNLRQKKLSLRKQDQSLVLFNFSQSHKFDSDNKLKGKSGFQQFLLIMHYFANNILKYSRVPHLRNHFSKLRFKGVSCRIRNVSKQCPCSLNLLPTGGIFIPHHQNISCHCETTKAMASKLCDFLFLPFCHNLRKC